MINEHVWELEYLCHEWKDSMPSRWQFMEKEMATHSSILAWKNLWTEESGGLKSMGLHDWACVHEGGGRWVGSNKLVELKKKKRWQFIANMNSVLCQSPSQQNDSNIYEEPRGSWIKLQDGGLGLVYIKMNYKVFIMELKTACTSTRRDSKQI